MLRTPVLLGLVALATQARSPAAELPVITNGTSGDQPAAKAPPPVIVNQPGVPKAAKATPIRIVVPLTVAAFADDVAPVTYNAYYNGPYAGIGFVNPYGAAGGYGYGWGGWGYSPYGNPAFSPSAFDLWPRVEVLDTGIRPNVGHLTSMPFPTPVYGSVLGVYYRR